MTLLAPTLESFFTDYLISQRAASGHTITSYRDTMRLLLGYAQQRTGIKPSQLDLSDLTAELIGAFLTMLQRDRRNSVRTRNARLAAIHSLFNHAALRHPEHAELIARVLAIPTKNGDEAVVTYLTDTEVEALLASPDPTTVTGRRDQLILLVMITTGVRVSELTGLTRADVSTTRPGAHISVHGKGRKQRITPLDAPTTKVLRAWLTEHPAPATTSVFTARGTDRKMSTDAVAHRVNLHVARAVARCPSLAAKNVTPHVLRHTCAMRMLAAGTGATTIALWLGHESPESTRPYIHADLDIKQRALDRTAPPRTAPGRYRPPDKLLAFLQAL